MHKFVKWAAASRDSLARVAPSRLLKNPVVLKLMA